MAIITVRTEKNLDQLLDKVYVGLNATEKKRVQAAVLKENPHLLETANFKPGAVIVLPDRGEAVKLPDTRDVKAADGVEYLAAEIKEYAPVLKRELETAREELEQSAKLFKSAAFKKLLDGLDATDAALVKSFESALKEDLTNNKEDLGSLAKGVEELQADLSQLLKGVS